MLSSQDRTDIENYLFSVTQFIKNPKLCILGQNIVGDPLAIVNTFLTAKSVMDKEEWIRIFKHLLPTTPHEKNRDKIDCFIAVTHEKQIPSLEENIENANCLLLAQTIGFEKNDEEGFEQSFQDKIDSLNKKSDELKRMGWHDFSHLFSKLFLEHQEEQTIAILLKHKIAFEMAVFDPMAQQNILKEIKALLETEALRMSKPDVTLFQSKLGYQQWLVNVRHVINVIEANIAATLAITQCSCKPTPKDLSYTIKVP